MFSLAPCGTTPTWPAPFCQRPSSVRVTAFIGSVLASCLASHSRCVCSTHPHQPTEAKMRLRSQSRADEYCLIWVCSLIFIRRVYVRMRALGMTENDELLLENDVAPDNILSFVLDPDRPRPPPRKPKFDYAAWSAMAPPTGGKSMGAPGNPPSTASDSATSFSFGASSGFTSFSFGPLDEANAYPSGGSASGTASDFFSTSSETSQSY